MKHMPPWLPTVVIVAVIAAVSVAAWRANPEGQAKAKLSRLARNLPLPLLLLDLATTAIIDPHLFATHPALTVYLATPVLLGIAWSLYRAEMARPGLFTSGINTGKRGRARRTTRREPKLVRPYWPLLRGWINLAFTEDLPQWRVAHLTVLAAGAIGAVAAPGNLSWVAPWPLLIITLGRYRLVSRKRTKVLGKIYAVANANLDYNKATSARNSPEKGQFSSVWGCVTAVWKNLTEYESVTIRFPIAFPKTDPSRRNKFEAEYNATADQEDGNGTQFVWDTVAGTVSASRAHYPQQVLWDGEQEKDPLTFLLGVDLDTGEWHHFTLGEASPHLLVTGTTGAGKSSTVEMMMAQALTKPLPWLPNRHWEVHIIDPKGPLADRWCRRPGVLATNGSRDDVDPGSGAKVPGILAMERHMDRIYSEMLRRADVLHEESAALWLELPDEIKAEKEFVPLLVVMDEYLDHVGKDPGQSEEIKELNDAKARVTYLAAEIARKGRNTGVHLVVIAQNAIMGDIGSTLKRTLPARVVMGNMDETAYKGMFETTAVPDLPATRVVDGKRKTIPGRGRFMNASGQPIHRLQVAWFGGPRNRDTLDKYLPEIAATSEPKPGEEGWVPTGPFNPFLLDDPTPYLSRVTSGTMPFNDNESVSKTRPPTHGDEESPFLDTPYDKDVAPDDEEDDDDADGSGHPSWDDLPDNAARIEHALDRVAHDPTLAVDGLTLDAQDRSLLKKRLGKLLDKVKASYVDEDAPSAPKRPKTPKARPAEPAPPAPAAVDVRAPSAVAPAPAQQATPSQRPATPRPAPVTEPVDLDLLVDAAEMVVSTQYASTAMLQRKLRLKHTEAVDLLAQLEAHGVVDCTDPAQVAVLVEPDGLDALTARLRGGGEPEPLTSTEPAVATVLGDEHGSSGGAWLTGREPWPGVDPEPVAELSELSDPFSAPLPEPPHTVPERPAAAPAGPRRSLPPIPHRARTAVAVEPAPVPTPAAAQVDDDDDPWW